MSASYTWVQWNKHKYMYDMVLAGAVVGYLAVFIGISMATYSGEHAISPLILLIRATGTLAVLMLTLILSVGPLARLWPTRFAPMLYNRRHFGVATFFVALTHGTLVMLWYGSFGKVNPLAAMLTMNPRYDSWVGFPFEVLGILALTILFFLAATSHDFWLKNLSPRLWKSLHMSVYLAYGLIVLHVVLGVVQSERSGLYPLLVLVAAVGLAVLHIFVGMKEHKRDSHNLPQQADGWVDVAAANDIPEGRAVVFKIKGCERIAVFKHEGRVSAVSNVCAHQAGPLGEGKIVDGCITCPWHGYQYRPESGQSPPPYTEKIPTYAVRIRGQRVEVDPTPLPPGTPAEPAAINGDADV